MRKFVFSLLVCLGLVGCSGPPEAPAVAEVEQPLTSFNYYLGPNSDFSTPCDTSLGFFCFGTGSAPNWLTTRVQDWNNFAPPNHNGDASGVQMTHNDEVNGIYIRKLEQDYANECSHLQTITSVWFDFLISTSNISEYLTIWQYPPRLVTDPPFPNYYDCATPLGTNLTRVEMSCLQNVNPLTGVAWTKADFGCGSNSRPLVNWSFFRSSQLPGTATVDGQVRALRVHILGQRN